MFEGGLRPTGKIIGNRIAGSCQNGCKSGMVIVELCGGFFGMAGAQICVDGSSFVDGIFQLKSEKFFQREPGSKILFFFGKIGAMFAVAHIPFVAVAVFCTNQVFFWEMGKLFLKCRDFRSEFLLLQEHFLIKHRCPPLK